MSHRRFRFTYLTYEPHYPVVPSELGRISL